ncbi:MAG: PilT/PilU family type 4a pilus ATPase [Pseudomonadota bacterium]
MEKGQLEKLLTSGIQRGASDIHFAVGHRPHYRVKGEMLAANSTAITQEDTIDIARIMLEDPNWEPDSLVRERDFSYSVAGIGRFRVHLFFQRGSIGIVIRVIPYEVRGFASLNLPEVLADIANAQKGLILITGAKGMGKSTAIAAMIKQINETRQGHIVTIEEPIESLYAHGKCIISQREVGSDTATFSDALVAALRQDPDVIMVGEVVEPAVAETCLKAAETGNLVIAAMSTQDVQHTIEGWLGLFPREMQESIRVRLADSLTAIISLRLLVNKTGLGLIPAVEILRGTRTVREHIRQGNSFAELKRIMEQGKDLYGMQTFDQHLIELCQTGLIKLKVGKSAASHTDEFERVIAKTIPEDKS